MAERILATGFIREQILIALQRYRDAHEDYAKEAHPQTGFLTLSELTTNNCYSSLIHQPLFLRATRLLTQRLKHYGPYELLDPSRSFLCQCQNHLSCLVPRTRCMLSLYWT